MFWHEYVSAGLPLEEAVRKTVAELPRRTPSSR